MISIQKGNAPKSLEEYDAKGYHFDEHVSFSKVKDDIRKALCKEQGYICCYCMRRIGPTKEGVQVAHIKNQYTHKALDCKYINHHGSCCDSKTCNQAQKNNDLKFSLTDPHHPIEQYIDYDTDGKIYSNDKEFDKQIDQLLNLNSTFLKLNRKHIYMGLRPIWKKANSYKEKKRNLEQALEDWTSKDKDKYKEYIGFALYFIKKRLGGCNKNN